MKKLFGAIGGLAIAVNCWASDLNALKTSQAINIDGKLNERAWQEAQVFSTFNSGEKSAIRRTEVKVIYNETEVIFGVKAFIPRSEIKAVKNANRDSCDVYRSEAFEVMLDVTDTGNDYFHFIVSAANGFYDAKREQGGYVTMATWDGKCSYAVQIENNFWTLELAVPYYTLEVSPETNRQQWRINFARNSFLPKGKEYSVITPTGTAHVAGDFLKINAPEVDLNNYFWHFDLPRLTGKISNAGFSANVGCSLENLSNKEQNVKISCFLISPSKKVRRHNLRFNFKPGEKKQLSFGPLLLPECGKYRGEIVVRSSSNNRIICRKPFSASAEYVPITIDLIDPHYRDAIFATQKLDSVRYNLKIDTADPKLAQVKSGIRTVKGKIVFEKSLPLKKLNKLEFPVAKIPQGRLEIFVELLDKNGKVFASANKAFRKLPYLKGEVYIGKDDMIYRDGKKIFVLACWNDDYNTAAYNVNMVENSPSEMIFNDTNDQPTWSKCIQELKKTQTVTPEIAATFRKYAAKGLNNPRILAHFVLDEPYYAITEACAVELTAPMKDEDPYHPVMFGCAPLYYKAGEFFATHPYPIVEIGKPFSNFRKFIADMERNYKDCYKKPGQWADLFLHQGFNYGDYDRRNSRIPTYDEYRTQGYLMLILGCQGLLHYNRTTKQYPELYIGMPHLRKEQMLVGNSLVIQEKPAKAPQCNNKNIRLMGRLNKDGNYWLMACNASDNAAKANINFAGFADAKLQVLSEGRTIKARQGEITDNFTPWQVHIYTNNLKDFGLKNVAKIKAEIEGEYAKRVKPGNLAYQRFEGETIDVCASSNKYGPQRPDNTLWHIADGVTSGKAITGGWRDGVLIFHDNTPGKTPDWIEMKFKKQVKVGRVVVYPVNNSLKDYEIQVKQNGKYVTVGKVVNAKGKIQTVTFTPVKTDTVRCYITANNGNHTQIYEIEIYEK